MNSFERMSINSTEGESWGEKQPEDDLNKLKDKIFEYIIKKQKEKRERERIKE
jgi:hypothetical protein